MFTQKMAWAGCVCILLFGCRNRGPQLSPDEAGGVFLEPGVIDLGSLKIGSSAKSFHADLVNHGAVPLEVMEIEASCGCMAVQISKPQCNPGEAIEITGLVRTERKPGRFRHKLKITEKGQTQDVHVLEIIGNTVAQLRFYPDPVILAPSIDGTLGEGVISLENEGPDSVTLQPPDAVPEGIKVDMAATSVNAYSALKIALSAAPTWVTESSFDLHISTSHPHENALTIPVRVIPKTSLKVVPQALRLGVVNKSWLLEKGAFEIRIFPPEDCAVSVNNVTTPPFVQLKESEAGEDEMMSRG